jgi:hypothetical protein
MKNLLAVSSALTWGLAQITANQLPGSVDYCGCERFVLAQIRSLPDWLKPPFIVLAYIMQFLALPIGLGWFNRLTPELRAKVVRFFEVLPGPTREFIRFHRVFVQFYLFEALGRTQKSA